VIAPGLGCDRAPVALGLAGESSPGCAGARRCDSGPGYAGARRYAGPLVVLWIRLKSVAAPEYALLNTGESITRGNSGNGVLPTLKRKNVGDKNIDITV